MTGCGDVEKFGQHSLGIGLLKESFRMYAMVQGVHARLPWHWSGLGSPAFAAGWLTDPEHVN